MRKLLVWLVGLVILLVVNFSIWQKEQLLAQGKTVILPLAPVDPRSLMQGDYMRLRFQLEDEIYPRLTRDKTDSIDGYAVVLVNEQGVGQFQQLATELPAALPTNQTALRYRVRDGQINFATNAFFFQEGHADDYAKARYGEFKVDDHGNLLLTRLRGQQLEVLGQAQQR